MGRKVKYTPEDVEKLFTLRLQGYNVRKISEIIKSVSYSTLIKLWNDLATPEQKQLANAAEAQRRNAMSAERRHAVQDIESLQGAPPLVASDAVSLHTEALNRMCETLGPLASIAESLERIAVALEARPQPKSVSTVSTNGNTADHAKVKVSLATVDDAELTRAQKLKIREHHNEGLCDDDIADLMGIDVDIITEYVQEFTVMEPFESVMQDEMNWG